MVMQMGMSEIVGPRYLASSTFDGSIPDGTKLMDKADEEIDRILNEQYERGMKLLTENKDVLDSIANILIEKERISGDELFEII